MCQFANLPTYEWLRFSWNYLLLADNTVNDVCISLISYKIPSSDGYFSEYLHNKSQYSVSSASFAAILNL